VPHRRLHPLRVFGGTLRFGSDGVCGVSHQNTH
jgi:hypothetical protein